MSIADSPHLSRMRFRAERTISGLPRGLTVEKAISGCSKIRNKAIAEALSYMRYVEGWGSGLLRVNAELADYGARPVALEDAGIATRMNVYEDNVSISEQILSKLKSNTRISVRQLASELPISTATVERTLHKLQSSGRICRKSGTRGVWEVLV